MKIKPFAIVFVACGLVGSNFGQPSTSGPGPAPGAIYLLAAANVLAGSPDLPSSRIKTAEAGVQPAQPDGLSPGEWSTVRDSIHAERHAFQATEGGYQARNQRFGWGAEFDGHSALIQPENQLAKHPTGSDWSFGLALQSYGFEGALNRVVSPEFGTCAEGQEITYDWSAELSEWWINDHRGFEHGFTVHERPARTGSGEAAPLIFDLEVLGSLEPQVNGTRTGLSLHDDAGASVLKYDGLVAFDANGAALSAWIEVDERHVRICVDEARAAYPIVVDPVVQSAYLKASNAEANDDFGYSVAVSGDTVVVGARFEDSSATGVNGNESSNSAVDSGAAYVYVRTGSTWTQQAYLKPSNTGPLSAIGYNDQFGSSVAISGDTIVVGAVGEASNATGVNGNQFDSSEDFSGAAYVFVRSGTTWTQQAYLKASNTESGDWFGYSVAASGDTVLVAAPFEDSSSTGIDGDQTNNASEGSGAVYVFTRSGTVWSQQAYLKASNTDNYDHFGHSISVSGDTIVAGSPGEDSNATGIDGDQSNQTSGLFFEGGAAYVFVRTGSTWAQQAYLKASNTDPGDEFGYSVAVTGDTIAVGALLEDSIATGVNGSQSNSAPATGAAYVFVRSGSVWSQQAYLKASNTGAFDQFGFTIAASGNTVVVGAHAEDSHATGVDGDQFSNSGADSGAAYVFVRSGSTWAQESYLKASNTDSSDVFATSVGVSGDYVVAGAFYEASSATGVNGNEFDNSAPRAGAAYIFDGNGAYGGVGTAYCQPERNSTLGVGRIAGVGSTVVADFDVTLVATGLPAHCNGIFLVGDMSDFVMNPGGSAGNLCIGGNLGRYVGPGQVQNSGAAGSFQLAIDLTNLPASPGFVLAGDTWFFQAWHRDVDPMGNPTSNYTDGLEVLFN